MGGFPDLGKQRGGCGVSGKQGGGKLKEDQESGETRNGKGKGVTKYSSAVSFLFLKRDLVTHPGYDRDRDRDNDRDHGLSIGLDINITAIDLDLEPILFLFILCKRSI